MKKAIKVLLLLIITGLLANLYFINQDFIHDKINELTNKETAVVDKEEYPEGYEEELAEQGPVDQTKKKMLNKDDEFGSLKFKISSEWKKTNKNDVVLYILNDTTSSHIQLEKITIENEIAEDEIKQFTEMAARTFFGVNARDVQERVIAGQIIRGMSGTIVGDGTPLGGVSYYYVDDKDVYRITILTKVETTQEDLLLFERFMDGFKLK